MNLTEELYERLKNLEVSINVDGLECPNPIPKVDNSGLKRPLTLQEQIMRIVRRQLSSLAEEKGLESFSEADDFTVETPDDTTKYTVMVDEYPIDNTIHREKAEPEPIESGGSDSESPGKDNST